jgi:AAA15 family ATPase/GTPase
MKLLEKIEIKHFRSFKETVKIINLKDINIFSGSNDVGKSNVLKVLNLFFNNEINLDENFNFEKDLSFLWKSESEAKIKKRKTKRKEEGSYASQRNLFVSIKIHFKRPISQDSPTPEKFWVEKRWDKNGLVGEYNTNVLTAYRKKNKNKTITATQENAQKGLVKRFLNSISFEYIPAVKDRNYFKYLFKKLQVSLLNRDKSFHRFSDNINKTISATTLDLFFEFKKNTGISATFSIPETLVDFFNTINVSTENGVSLYSRGDGIQARFIPAILNDIAKGKQYVLWGFEEPENSYEYLFAEKLAADFLNEYSKDKQIFITSHTKEFLSLIKGFEERVALFRVYKTFMGDSLVEVYIKNSGFNKQHIIEGIVGEKEIDKLEEKEKNVLDKIFEDIGFLETDQYLIEDFQNQLKERDKILASYSLTIQEKEKIVSKLNREIKKTLLDKDKLQREIEEYRKPILYVEDKYDEIYKIAFLKLNEEEFSIDLLDEVFQKKSFFVINNGGGVGGVGGLLRTEDVSLYEDKKIIGLFDFDTAGREQFHCLSKHDFWKDENGKKIPLGDQRTGYYKKRKDHPYFYAMLLPIPEELDYLANISWSHNVSYAEIENLLPKNFLIDNNLVDVKSETVGNIYKFKDVKKKSLGKKLLNLNREDFKNFEPLFEKIKELTIK